MVEVGVDIVTLTFLKVSSLSC